MPTDAYIQHLETQLANVDAKLARAKAAIGEGRRACRHAGALADKTLLSLLPQPALFPDVPEQPCRRSAHEQKREGIAKVPAKFGHVPRR